MGIRVVRIGRSGSERRLAEKGCSWSLTAESGARSHRQMSMHQCAQTWRPPLPRPAGNPDLAAARRVARAGRAAIRRQHPYSLRARRGRSLPRRGELIFRTPTRHRPPNQDPGRILIPGDGAAGDQGAQTWPVCPAMAATRRLRPVPSPTTSWRYGPRRTCRLVTGRSHRPRSTWPNQARLALLAVTHRYKQTHCLWLEQFQIAEYSRLP